MQRPGGAKVSENPSRTSKRREHRLRLCGDEEWALGVREGSKTDCSAGRVQWLCQTHV